MKRPAALFTVVTVSVLMMAGGLPAATPRVLGLSEGKVRAANPQAIEHLRLAQKLMAQALFHMQQAEELQPGVGDEISAPIDPDERLSRSIRSTRSVRGARGTGEVQVTPTKTPDPDEERRKLDESYDRGKKGVGVLARTLNILSKIPIIKKFVSGHAGDVADAAGKVGAQVTKSRDGHANINGELKVWNEKAGRWEDF